MRTVTEMSNPSYRSNKILNGKLCAINKKDFNLDKYLPNTVVDYDFKLDELQFRCRFMKGSRVHSFLFFINDNFVKTIRRAIRFN